MANEATCKANDCNREVIARGYCRKHFRLWKAGEMPKPRYKTCTSEKCHKPRFRASLCEEHWTAKHGKATEAVVAAATPASVPAADASA
jgi:hypothetical protein